MKIGIKNKQELKYIDTAKLEIGDITLLELVSKVNRQQDIIVSLLNEISQCHIVKKDTAYIIALGTELKRIDKLELIEEQDLKWPLSFYGIVDGKIELNKKKVVVL